MTVSTTGIEVRTKSRWVRDCVELVSSMRFSISLLTVICIASVIGTVVKQHEPYNNYVNQFGPFWAELFGKVGLYTVYSVWWFLLILAFLVLSTSLCIARNVPKIVVDLRTYKEQVREQALSSFHHRGQAEVAESRDQAFDRISALLVHGGWKAKVQVRENGTMIAARRGAANKLGYIAAHSAIVLVCVGGLLDGDLIVRAQMALQGKSTYSGGGLMKDVPVNYRLGPGTPTFRANLLVPEGGRTGTAVINMQNGVVLQDLPFDVELKKFIVDYYETGMPKLFASEIVIHDRDSGAAIPALVKVNEPAFHRGVAIYQSSFDDGGSTLKLRGIPMAAGGKPFDIEGAVGGNAQISNGDAKLTLEFTGLRVINVENLGGRSGGDTDGGRATDVRKVDLVSSLKNHLGSGAKGIDKKELRNVGPSVSYKLRDAAGQAREFNNYMLPVKVDASETSPAVYLLGVRDTPAAAFQYLRIPVDPEGGMQTFLRVRAALLDPAQREQAVMRYASQALGQERPELTQQLGASASKALGLFAGAGADGEVNDAKNSGLQAISSFMEANVPEAERNRAGEVLIRILNGVLFEITQSTRVQAGLSLLPQDDKTQAFMSQMVLSLSDVPHYPAPMAFQLKDFTQVQASVFQVARAPGKNIVYLGCAFLIVGIFAMLYVRERRVWVWLAPRQGVGSESVTGDTQGSHATMALSTNRKTMDGDKEFEMLKTRLLQAPV